jgi:filamentous hemagglutinin family protein
VNLFHSFGDFNVPNNNVANFLNNSGLATSNILGRVTGGNVSNIFGTIQTTGFGNANLFLMNPTGFLFGPNTMVNVGGMVTFTSADYLRLSDGARFNAVPHTIPDQLLSASPVAAFGFLGSNPGAITVQGSQLAVAEGTGISLVGGNITVQGGTLTAPSGQINLVSVGKPSHHHVGGEVANGGEFAATGFKSLGAVTLSQGTTVDTSGTAGSGQTAGGVLIRAGQFVMNASTLRAVPAANSSFQTPGNIEVTAQHVTLSNHSTIDTSSRADFASAAGNITFNVNTFSATDSSIAANVNTGDNSAPSGTVTIQGLQGAGATARAVSLTNTAVDTSNNSLPANPLGVKGGPILIRADNIALNQSSLNTLSFEQTGGAITLESSGRIVSHDSSITSSSFFGSGGTIDLRAGKTIDLSNTTVSALSSFFKGGTINLSAPKISLEGSHLDVGTQSNSPGGSISLKAEKSVTLTDTSLSADNTLPSDVPLGIPRHSDGGTISIDGGHKVTSQQSTVSAESAAGNGGTIHIEANTVGLTDTQVTTSVSGGPQTVGGNISLDVHTVTLKNSEVLSTATEGHGGTIGITTHKLHSTNSVIDATSQFGTDGTVTIEHP